MTHCDSNTDKGSWNASAIKGTNLVNDKLRRVRRADEYELIEIPILKDRVYPIEK